MKLIRSNAVASIALFVALGGGSAYAADTVFSTDIVDGEVKSVDVEDNGLTGTDVSGLGSADVTDQSLTGNDVSGLGSADVIDQSLTAADVSGLGTDDIGGLTGTDINTDSLTGSDIDENSLSVANMGCKTGKVLGFARIKGTSGTPNVYVDEGAFIDLKNTCANGRVEVRRQSTGVYFVRFVDHPAVLALAVPNQDGATSALSGDTDNTLTVGKVTSGNDTGAFRVDIKDLPDGLPQDGKFTIMLP